MVLIPVRKHNQGVVFDRDMLVDLIAKDVSNLSAVVNLQERLQILIKNADGVPLADVMNPNSTNGRHPTSRM
ncbi:hypothetical protein ABB25_12980 [Stenotrophomonas koreensis]|uniref:Uncharacterized protein n=1 Tax=Stenotrophomonas koreensis TaxID=266128 RepID=A0A0R0BC18_9GAMM|nr:hypothetical protein ABB25_12980 [Stenotrophomonas koreensis]